MKKFLLAALLIIGVLSSINSQSQDLEELLFNLPDVSLKKIEQNIVLRLLMNQKLSNH